MPGPRILLAAGLVALVACTDPAGSEQAGEPDRPNILIIITDDQPLDTLDVMPDTKRFFVRGGSTLAHAFATNPVCCPARATLMTGRYTHNNGVRSNEDVDQLDMDTTLQAHLREAGYYTALYGKFLNRWHEDPPHFDRWGVITGRYRYFDESWNIDGERTPVEGYWTDLLAEHSTVFLSEADAERDDQPWLLYISIPAPHSPYKPSPAYEDAEVPPWDPSPAVGEQDKSDKPPYVHAEERTLRRAKRVRELQLQTLMSVDDLVADVMGMLDELGEDNTLAIFMSDNGYLWGEHDLMGAHLSKGNPYTRSVQIPVFLRWPGQIDEGTVDRRLVGLIDLAPTIYEAVGIEPRADVPHDGRSLLQEWSRPHILNEYRQKTDEHRSTVPDWTSLRTKRYSYVEYTSGDEIVFREYYDLRADPHELRNLLGDDNPSNDPDVAELHTLLLQAQTCAGATCP